jgi:stage II sporulation protein AA (anti-sigma F factor antagonist)
MDNKELTIREEIKSNTYILRFTGDITKDSGNMLLLWRNWENGLPEGIKVLIADFSKINYINSAGIAALIRLFRIGRDGLYKSRSFGLNYHYEKLFRMVGLDKYLTFYPSEWSALDSISSGEAESDIMA